MGKARVSDDAKRRVLARGKCILLLCHTRFLKMQPIHKTGRPSEGTSLFAARQITQFFRNSPAAHSKRGATSQERMPSRMKPSLQRTQYKHAQNAEGLCFRCLAPAFLFAVSVRYASALDLVN